MILISVVTAKMGFILRLLWVDLVQFLNERHIEVYSQLFVDKIQLPQSSKHFRHQKLLHLLAHIFFSFLDRDTSTLCDFTNHDVLKGPLSWNGASSTMGL